MSRWTGKRPLIEDSELGRGKARKACRQETETFEQFELCEIPRKMNRNRTVRSAPTTISRQRSGSISPINLLSIELSNPTPQMLEVMEIIRQKQENNERVLNLIDSNNLNFVHKKNESGLSLRVERDPKPVN